MEKARSQAAEAYTRLSEVGGGGWRGGYKWWVWVVMSGAEGLHPAFLLSSFFSLLSSLLFSSLLFSSLLFSSLLFSSLLFSSLLFYLTLFPSFSTVRTGSIAVCSLARPRLRPPFACGRWTKLQIELAEPDTIPIWSFSNLTVLLFACENVEESKFKIWQITDTLTQMLSGQLQLQTLDYWGASTLYALLKTPCVSLLFPLFSLLFLGCFCLIFGRFWSGFPWQRASTRSTSPARLVGFWLFF